MRFFWQNYVTMEFMEWAWTGSKLILLTGNKRSKLPQNLKNEPFCRWETIKNCVPQGSILGPLLFLIYVNDLPHRINKFASPVIYADNTSVLFSTKKLKNLQSKIDSTLHYISEWFLFSGLTLNMEETNMIKSCINHLLNNQQQCTTDNYLMKLQISDSWD